MLNQMMNSELLHYAIRAAIAGSREILEVYRKDFAVEFKDDKSPLTLADRNAHEAISKILENTGLPVLSEEGKSIPYELRKAWKRFWLVDPLDGTKEFVKRNDEFTVNIALIEENRPVMGVILVPVSGLLYFACHSSGAFKITIDGDAAHGMEELMERAARLPVGIGPQSYTVVGSRSHLSPETQQYIDKLSTEEPGLDFVSIGSSLKLCLVAEGTAHIYPRFGPTMEWDTAAGQAIVEVSGGKVLIAGTDVPVRYNKPDLLNPYFIASRPK
jgi:3'(2'), 5'-bisphosphate nucleotidase